MPRRSIFHLRIEITAALLALCAPFFGALPANAQDNSAPETDAAVAAEGPAKESSPAQTPQLPADVQQLLIGVAEGWNSSRGKLWRFERKHSAGKTTATGGRDASPTAHTATTTATSPWTRLTNEDGVDILLGRNGLAWGRGALTIPQSLLKRHANTKREGDRRAPAGCFAIPKIYGDDPALPGKASFPYRQVSRWDAWPDDPKNPFYNRHVIIDPEQGVPSWFEKQRMRRGDPAYRWLVEVRHNSDPPQPGAGSAIFFHVRRGPDRTTAGCTTMSEGNLSAVVEWLKAEAHPHYVLLPKAEYEILAPLWKLPPL